MSILQFIAKSNSLTEMKGFLDISNILGGNAGLLIKNALQSRAKRILEKDFTSPIAGGEGPPISIGIGDVIDGQPPIETPDTTILTDPVLEPASPIAGGTGQPLDIGIGDVIDGEPPIEIGGEIMFTEDEISADGAESLEIEVDKFDTAEEFINENIDGDKKRFKFGGESVFHETDPETARVLSNSTVDKTGLNVSTNPELALGQGGKGAIVEFDKQHLQDDRGSFITIQKPGIVSGITEGKELRLIGGSQSPTTVKSVTLKPGVKLDKRTERTFKNFFNSKKLEDGSIKLTPKWLDNKIQELTDIFNKAKSGT